MSSSFSSSVFRQYIHQSRYARWLPESNRRETWEETVDRYFKFFDEHLKAKCGYIPSHPLRARLHRAVLNQDIMPSMRALMTAGPALERDHAAGYNCAFVAIDKPTVFDEILYILMCGTGVGYSVERQAINKLPIISEEFVRTQTCIIVEDSKVSWAKAFRELVALLYAGQIPSWDVSKVRPSGAPLKVFGGRASGPEPLVRLFHFSVEMFKRNAGRKLSTLDCHDLVCKIADVVVVGGVRRAALISLSDLGDDLMRTAKSGTWWTEFPHRALANISYVAEEQPPIGLFMKEWLSLYESRSGERGIFSRLAAKNHAKHGGRRDSDQDFGTNPCSEIVLRNKQFCNLTEAIIRPEDTRETLKQKIELATILGTWQSTLTGFRYLSSAWKKNCEEERLLGVSMTGIYDNPITYHRGQDLNALLTELREHAVAVNEKTAKELNISPSVAVTCVKPSGTVSSLVDSASGIHPRHAEYYIRTVRADKKDPLAKMMVGAGFPHEDEIFHTDSVWVFSFPMKSPEEAITRTDITAVEHMELWHDYQTYFCEHKPSVTINVKDREWLVVGDWVYQHYEEISGMAFLPFNDSSYQQAPFQDCDEETYKALLAKMPKTVDWSDLRRFEHVDTTSGTQELACTGASSCDLIGLAATNQVLVD